MNPFTRDQANTIAGVLRHVRERVRRGEVGVAMADYAIEKGLEDMLRLHSSRFDRAAFASRVHLGYRPSYDEDRGDQPDDNEELEAAGEVLDRIEEAEVTPLSIWLFNAFDILKSILQDSDTTGRFLDVEKEAMPGVLQRVEDMVEHLRNMPKEEHICVPACRVGLGHYSEGGS